MVKSNLFVGREREIAELEAFLERALGGQGQICFMAGEAGSGKTTLVSEFARRAQQRHDKLVVARGECNAQTGVGDAYLPFREVLDLLTGGVDDSLEQGTITEENARRLRSLLDSSIEALVEIGPELVGVVLPWASLAVRLGAFAAERAGLVDRLKQLTARQAEKPEVVSSEPLGQDRIFEQYVKVLRTLAAEHPLMVVLDDLQWADASSVGLLFHLSRRIKGARILVVGTYRRDEVALGRAGGEHPLQKVLAELKRYRGDIWLDLDRAQKVEGRRFVDQLLDAEPNQLDETFRKTLLWHTGGNPLLIVELLQHMRERGDVARDDQGRWIEALSVDWSLLPARVEGVVEERIRRLKEEQRESLTVASVEGVNFTAEVVGEVQGLRARQVVRGLSGELAKKHHLVEAQGTERVAGQRLSRYRFRHHLFQRYLYDVLDPIEQTYLHEDVGLVLEELYGDQDDQIAVQLARHFTAADVPEKARHYLRISGEQAAARYANQEAVDYLSRALDLTPEDQPKDRYALLLRREHILHIQGAREGQQADLAALEELADALRSPTKQVEVNLRRARCAEALSDYPEAIDAARRAIELARSTGDRASEAIGHLQWGRAAWHHGDYAAARDQLQHALAVSKDVGERSVTADCLSNLGIVSWYQGHFSEATHHLQQALTIKHDTSDRQGEAHVLTNLAGVSYEQGEHGQAAAYQEEALDIYRAIGYRRGEGMALCNLSVFLVEQGDYGRATAYLEKCLPIYRETGDREGVTASLINLGLASLYQGNHAEAKRHLQRALTQSREIHDRKGETEALIYLSLVDHQRGDHAAAQAWSEEALQLANQTSDLRSRSHALTHLGHARAGLGSLPEAAAAYEEAVDLRHRQGEHHREMESRAGLARVLLAQGKPAQAHSHVEAILSYLEDHTLEGTDEPVRIYTTCYRVLQASEDPRAQEMLAAARKLFEARAAKIEDPALRESFAEDVPAHRDLIKTLTTVSGSVSSDD